MRRSATCKDTTCFNEHEKLNVICEKSECKFWHEKPECQNCVLIAANQGEKTLQEIGDMFGVTRMRICQIEKQIFRKLATNQKLNS